MFRRLSYAIAGCCAGTAGYEVKSLEEINGIRSWKFDLLDPASPGQPADARHERFACVAKPG
jgi:hypothetical protein